MPMLDVEWGTLWGVVEWRESSSSYGDDGGGGGAGDEGGDGDDGSGDESKDSQYEEIDEDAILGPEDVATDWWEVFREQRRRAAERFWEDRFSAKRCNSYQTRRASRLVTRYFDRELRARGVELRSTQLAVLRAIRDWNFASRDRMRDVAKKLWMHPSTLSRAIDRLEERGLVVVESAPWDRRCRIARLTALGVTTLRDAHEPWMLAQNVLRISLRDDEKAVLGVRLMGDAARRRLHAQGLRWEMWAPPGVEPSMMI